MAKSKMIEQDSEHEFLKDLIDRLQVQIDVMNSATVGFHRRLLLVESELDKHLKK